MLAYANQHDELVCMRTGAWEVQRKGILGVLRDCATVQTVPHFWSHFTFCTCNFAYYLNCLHCMAFSPKVEEEIVLNPSKTLYAYPPPKERKRIDARPYSPDRYWVESVACVHLVRRRVARAREHLARELVPALGVIATRARHSAGHGSRY